MCCRDITGITLTRTPALRYHERMLSKALP